MHFTQTDAQRSWSRSTYWIMVASYHMAQKFYMEFKIKIHKLDRDLLYIRE